jgi:hypothetical protein
MHTHTHTLPAGRCRTPPPPRTHTEGEGEHPHTHARTHARTHAHARMSHRVVGLRRCRRSRRGRTGGIVEAAPCRVESASVESLGRGPHRWSRRAAPPGHRGESAGR